MLFKQKNIYVISIYMIFEYSKLILTQIFKKFPALYENLKTIELF
jgi:hypothetical protein